MHKNTRPFLHPYAGNLASRKWGGEVLITTKIAKKAENLSSLPDYRRAAGHTRQSMAVAIGFLKRRRYDLAIHPY